MNMLSILITILLPVTIFILPGITLLAKRKGESVLAAISYITAVSLIVHLLLTLIVTLLALPMAIAYLSITLLTGYGLYKNRTYLTPARSYLLGFLAITFVFYLLLATPLLLIKHGLPTGDSQKAIFWGQQILQTQSLPQYALSLPQLNRDPVDFYTPALHVLTAYIMYPTNEPLIAVSFSALAAVIALAWLTASLTHEAFGSKQSLLRFAPALAVLLLLSNVRLLRYVREPGYHFQNIFGELLVFMTVFITLRLLKRWRLLDAVIGFAALLCLFFTHQFSAFIAAFVGLPLIAILVWHYRQTLASWSRHHVAATASGLTVLIILVLTFAYQLDLIHKIPHLFTANPHLASLIPPLAAYPQTMGTWWFVAGLGGLILITVRAVRSRNSALITLTTSIIVLLLLSFGPALGIDIPPIRALFYTTVPLSITGAYFLLTTAAAALHLQPIPRYLALFFLASATLASVTGGISTAFSSSSPTNPANSTLTPGIAELIDRFKTTPAPGAIVIDDFNRRAASWLLLSNQPTYSRLSSNLERIMDEAGQSEVRRQLYLKQLDIEKIYALGSFPEITQLMAKHAIGTVIGTDNQSAGAFGRNPALTRTAQAENLQVFSPNEITSCRNSDTTCRWLLSTSTLANDIGDREDTFEHLPASIRATRLSDPLLAEDGTTYRTTNAPLIPLTFNVDDYIAALWDQDHDSVPDLHLEFLITLAEHLPASGQPVQTLTIRTAANETYTLTPGQLVRLPGRHLPISEKGFIALTIENSTEQDIAIDSIALGTAHIP